MTVSAVSSELLILLQPDINWWYIAINLNVVWENWIAGFKSKSQWRFKMPVSICPANIFWATEIQQATGPHGDLLTIVKRRKLQCYCHVSRSSGLAKTILQGTVKGGRRQDGQRKRWEDNIREWTGLGVRQVPEGSGEQGKMEKTGCKIICGAPTTLAVKGLMMMMMMMMMSHWTFWDRTLYGDGSPWAIVSCRKIGVPTPRSRSQGLCH